jgi:hypothetical protein
MRKLIEVIAAFPIVATPVLAIGRSCFGTSEDADFRLTLPIALVPIAGTLAGFALCPGALVISPTFREGDAEVR